MPEKQRSVARRNVAPHPGALDGDGTVALYSEAEAPDMPADLEAALQRNQLLALLPAATLERLRPHLEFVHVVMRQPLVEPHERIAHVFFPLDAVLSVVKVMEDGTEVEVSTVGYEAMALADVFLGGQRAPVRMFCQVPGSVLRIDAAMFRGLSASDAALRDLMERCTRFQIAQLEQSIACNRLHAVQARAARWLLMTHDRVMRADEFPLTQEFLAIMLGVRRASVSVAAEALQKQQLIRYRRGWIAVTDRPGLEAASCECYRTHQADYTALLGAGTPEPGSARAG